MAEDLPLVMHRVWISKAQLRALAASIATAPAAGYTHALMPTPTETLAQRAERLRRLANKGRKRAW